MPSDAAPLAGHGWAWLGAMVPSVPKLALGVGMASRHVFKSLARARSQGAWQGHGPPGQCHRMPRGWPRPWSAPKAWGAMVQSVPKVALGVGMAFRHVFKSLARARSQGAWQGHGPPGQCHRMPRPWPGMAGHGWAPWCQVLRSWP